MWPARRFDPAHEKIQSCHKKPDTLSFENRRYFLSPDLFRYLKIINQSYLCVEAANQTPVSHHARTGENIQFVQKH